MLRSIRPYSATGLALACLFAATLPAVASEPSDSGSWSDTFEQRKAWWSLTPIRRPELPAVQDGSWAEHPVDRFVLARLEASQLQPAQRAERHVLLRRLCLVLTGLPPTPDQVTRFLDDRDPQAFERLVDRLLASPHFGERWARHWMDWIRYAESHGSEGDPPIDGAWHYRDYLIRALNADVPYDQLLREHVAGDLLERPRINRSLGINESRIGTAHWRMVFHGFAPTDALDEKVRFIDDQINAFSKAFLGLTVSCARCHNHKFDAISQQDYYALFGVLASCRPGRATLQLTDDLQQHDAALKDLKAQLRKAIAADWLQSLDKLPEQLLGRKPPDGKAQDANPVLALWWRMNKVPADKFAEAWKGELETLQQAQQRRLERRQSDDPHRWDLAHANTRNDGVQDLIERGSAGASPSQTARHHYLNQWIAHGTGLHASTDPSGQFAVAPQGDQALVGIYPAGIYSHLVSDKHSARLTSPDLVLNGEFQLWARVRGGGGAMIRYVVQDYPRSGTVYPVAEVKADWQWQRFNLDYWNGDTIHVELTTARDAPLLAKDQARSWFGVREVLLVEKGQPVPPAETIEALETLLDANDSAPPESAGQWADLLADTIRAAVEAWRTESASDAQALLLDACLNDQLISNRLAGLPTARPLILAYRDLEAAIPVATRIPTLDESVGRNHPLFERGDHKRPGAEVPRRFLEVIDTTPYQTTDSGRRQLADDLVRSDNPLTRRVIANRVWHHVFGRGLVSTPDNLGQLGDPPTHPELLDYLAGRFEHDGWSLKKLIRLMVTSQSWQLSSRASDMAHRVDPDNRLLSHAHVRRLEAEAIRDALLTSANRLDPQMYGPPVGGDAARRSVYINVKRNSLDPFLRVFDFPEPFSATGRRDVTNVPAQSLTMMNDSRVDALAAAWAVGILGDSRWSSESDRIRQMFLTALGRPPASDELQRAEEFLADVSQQQRQRVEQLAELAARQAALQQDITGLLEPARQQLLDKAAGPADRAAMSLPQPVAEWNFDEDAQDQIGSAHAQTQDGARLDQGAALLDGHMAHLITAPLEFSLGEKTLEAWVQLNRLDQRGGGVLSVQTPNGQVFDAIVFAEKDPRQWLAGSNNFARTQSFQGPGESEAAERPVHLAIAYHKDGRIAGYRDGQPYGTAYSSRGLQHFKAGETVVGFGVRHLPASGNRMLSGRVLHARLYDRALTDEQLRVSAELPSVFVSETQLLAALSDADRQRVSELREELSRIEVAITSLGPQSATPAQQVAWTELARAIFCFAEFIYLE